MQKRILTTAQNLEEKVAALITNSPIPKGLAADQLEQYKGGIESLAKEFSDQAGEYKKLLAKIDEQVEKENADKRPIYGLDVANWSPPKHAAQSVLESLMEKKNFVGALITLDRFKRAGQMKDEEYYAWRVKIILTHAQSEFTKEYLHGELVNAKQESVIAQWRKQAL